MTYIEAKNYVKNNILIGLDVDENDWCALVKIRHKNIIFPEYGVDGSLRDSSEWAFLDMTGRIDAGEYGDIYYI